MPNPYLMYEFENVEGIIEPIAFSRPFQVLTTHNLSDIPHIMEQVEKAVDNGYYAAGYVSYEAAPAFHPEMSVASGSELPLIWFGIFKEPEAPFADNMLDRFNISQWQLTSSAQQYERAIDHIKGAIEEGHTYQVNFTERLQASFTGSDRAFYRQLARNQQAGYGAYLNTGRFRVLSASPELFFRVQNGKITTKPMKGTAARGRTLEEDRINAAQLHSSVKERAENLMIVDLLRNDMSRIAEPGSVKVPKLFQVETYPTVLQLTSTIEADLVPHLTVFDWFKALFPCGSITGAPKISTMQTIAEIEQSPRGVYCGAIGFITPEKNAIFNVPIRTVVIDAETETAIYGVGGGITWDSTAQGEFQELHAKAKVLTAQRPVFSLLESLRLEDGKYPLLEYHLHRLEKSAAYFGFALDLQQTEQQLAGLAEELSKGIYKVRLLMDRDGASTLEAQPALPIAQPVKTVLARSPVDSTDPFLFHKTTHRQVYERAQQGEDAFAVLLWNESGELTEFTIGNLVVEKDGRFYTPPLQCGLLAGTFRQQLLDSGEISEQIIKKESLAQWDGIWLINGVRGWLKVRCHLSH